MSTLSKASSFFSSRFHFSVKLSYCIKQQLSSISKNCNLPSSLFNTSTNSNYSHNLVKGTRKDSKKCFLKYNWETYACFISTKFCANHRKSSGTFITAVYRHNVKSQSGWDVTKKNCFVTKQTVGCDITSGLLYTKRRYNVGRWSAEWAVRLPGYTNMSCKSKVTGEWGIGKDVSGCGSDVICLPP